MSTSNLNDWYPFLQQLGSGDEFNILLLGETGVGKTTFINSFANYLTYNTLNTAMQGEMQVLIPSSFYVTNPDTYESSTINIASKNQNENFDAKGQSNTQGCKSYVFSIGNRKLRFIDAPGVGDTRGVEQDSKNFEDILAFISQYDHLNGICILLKPNEERLNILFRFCIKELLTHLHVNAKDNIVFVFTNARSTFYMPGTTAPLLKCLLKELRESTGVDVPFSKENTFSFDNESFRFLATCKHGIKFPKGQIEDFSKSWDVSVNEYGCLVSRIVMCKPHTVSDTTSLNEAKQLIKKLARPIGEVATLIQENIQLAERQKQNLLADPSLLSANTMERRKKALLPQKQAEIIRLDYPRTVCTNDGCTRVVIVDGTEKVDYFQRCHEHCYLPNVEQEVINNPALQHCTAMQKLKDTCELCGCHWKMHMHITYEYRKFLTYLDMKMRRVSSSTLQHPFRGQSSNEKISTNPNNLDQWIDSINQRVASLKHEQTAMLEVCAKLSQFLQANAITPFNDDIAEYIRHFIHEEQMKRNSGAQNSDVINGLENMVADYKREMDLFKQAINEVGFTNKSSRTAPQAHEIFGLVKKLYALPINGSKIREQVEIMKSNQLKIRLNQEQNVQLPAIASTSSIMITLKEVLDQSK